MVRHAEIVSLRKFSFWDEGRMRSCTAINIYFKSNGSNPLRLAERAGESPEEYDKKCRLRERRTGL